jgi:ABC-type dipeptide/oligopeptide/nickel transport system ATPase component
MEAGRDRPIEPIPGAMPDPLAMPAGCAFHPRCDRFRPGLCDRPEAAAELTQLGASHAARCERLLPELAA